MSWKIIYEETVTRQRWAEVENDKGFEAALSAFWNGGTIAGGEDLNAKVQVSRKVLDYYKKK